MKKLLVLFIALTLIFVPNLKARALSQPTVAGEGAILMDMNTGQVLYEKNPDVKYEPASTTKIMTAILTLENTNLSDKVVVGSKPGYEDGSKIYTLEGEEFTVEQLLNALLIKSANDAALALAEYIAGSKENFAKMMNERAREIGCTNTNFANPNGLPDDNHYTTARDLALIGIEAMKNPKFREIITTKQYIIPPTNKQTETRYLYNHNKLLTSNQYKYEYATGIKTGYTGRAKNTFVGSATKDGHSLIAVILKSQTTYYPDVKNLFEWGFNNFSYNEIISKDEIAVNIKINDSSKEIPLYPGEGLYYTSLKEKGPVVTTEPILESTLTEFNRGDTVGYMDVKVDGNFLKKIPLIAGDSYSSSLYTLSLTENGVYKEKLKSSVKYLSAGSFFGLFVISGFYLKISKMRKEKRRNAYKNSRLF